MSLAVQRDAARQDRIEISRTGTLRDRGGAPVDVAIDNLSGSGCLFVADCELMINDLVTLGIPGVGLRPAIISRVDRPNYACAFLVPLSEAAVVAAPLAETVVTSRFAPLPASTSDRPLAVEIFPESKLSPLARVAIISGLSIISWSAIIAAVSILVG